MTPTLTPTLTPTILALGLFLSAITHGYRGVSLGISIICFCVVFGLSKRSTKNRWVLLSLILILVSAYVAVGTSYLWGTGYWIETLSIALWMTPFLLLYLIDSDDKPLVYLLPLILLHTGILLYQGGIGEYRSSGLVDNPNPGSTLILIGVIVSIYSGWGWTSIPMVVGMLFTGSRSTLLALTGIIPLMSIVESVNYRPMIIGFALVILLITIGFGTIKEGYRITETTQGTVTKGVGDLKGRLELTHHPSLVPLGYTYSLGLHNLPFRMSVELGIAAAVLWVGVTGYALTKKPRGTLSWWILLVLTILSTTEYHTFLGPTASFWWLTIGMRGKEIVKPD